MVGSTNFTCEMNDLSPKNIGEAHENPAAGSGGVFCVNVRVNASVVQLIFFFCWI